MNLWSVVIDFSVLLARTEVTRQSLGMSKKGCIWVPLKVEKMDKQLAIKQTSANIERWNNVSSNTASLEKGLSLK